MDGGAGLSGIISLTRHSRQPLAKFPVKLLEKVPSSRRGCGMPFVEVKAHFKDPLTVQIVLFAIAHLSLNDPSCGVDQNWA
jgi:hypothetical protein